MFIPEHRKIAFIHIHRTGGTTVTQLLNKMRHPTNVIIAGHCHLKNIYGDFDHYEDDFFTFSFVRNPWERLLSWFLFLKQRNTQHLDFTNFLEQLDDNRGYKSGDFMTNQVDYLAPAEGGNEVDFIGKYENFQADLKQVFEILEIPVFEIPILNTTTKKFPSDYYNETTKNMVARMCEKDIDTFKYNFKTKPVYG